MPFLDALGYRRDPQSQAIAMADYGNPDDPAHAAWLRSWSPYQNLRDGVAYPAALLDAGAEDTLLRVRAESGHNQMTEAPMAERDAEELVFFANALGLWT